MIKRNLEAKTWPLKRDFGHYKGGRPDLKNKIKTREKRKKEGRRRKKARQESLGFAGIF